MVLTVPGWTKSIQPDRIYVEQCPEGYTSPGTSVHCYFCKAVRTKG